MSALFSNTDRLLHDADMAIRRELSARNPAQRRAAGQTLGPCSSGIRTRAPRPKSKVALQLALQGNF